MRSSSSVAPRSAPAGTELTSATPTDLGGRPAPFEAKPLQREGADRPRRTAPDAAAGAGASAGWRRRAQRASRAVAAAGVEAVLAGAVVAAVEGARAATASGAALEPRTAAVVAALALPLAAGGALGVAASARALGTIPPVSAWRRGLAAGGTARAVALWRAALTAAAASGLALFTLAAASAAHGALRFLEGGTAGLVLAAVITPGALAIGVAALALDRRVAAALARTARAPVGHRVVSALPALGVAALAVEPALAVHLAAPAVTLDPVLLGGSLAAAAAAARWLRLGRRRGAGIAAGAILAAGIAGIALAPGAPEARSAAIGAGSFSGVALRALHRAGDGDGDGYAAPRVGGADCDDGDPRRSPAARDVAGNGIDENCSGRDALLEHAIERAAPRPAAADRPGAPPARPSLVVITIDTLRADRLGAYGYARPTSPAIDALAATATRFAWAFTSCPATRCSVPALHTGRLYSNADPEAPTLAAVLGAAGYDTAAVTCCARFGPQSTDVTGFSWIDVSADAERVARPGQSNGDVVAAAALRWLEQRRAGAPPFFLWIHFYDPHHPYLAPEGATRFGSGASDRYDAEIAYVDRHVARVLAALDPATTAVALTADHGEELGDRRTRFHARSLRNAVTRIPLVIRIPGGAPGRVIGTPVSLVDVAPTLLDVAGVDAPAGMNGRSLAPALRAGGELPARPVLVELVPDGVLTRDIAAAALFPWKVVWERDADAWSLYSLAGDPAAGPPGDRDDAVDPARVDPALWAALRQRLLDTVDRELGAKP